MNEQKLQIWIDADSCPVQARTLAIKFSQRLQIPLIFVANKKIPFEKNASVKMIITSSEPDAADNYIVEHSEHFDIVITRDIPLASRLLQKNITVINDRGILFSENNIREKLSMRNFSYSLIEAGIPVEKSGSYSSKDLNEFANCLDREIAKKQKLIIQATQL